MNRDAQIVRENIRAIHDERLKLLQVGIALLAALETALFYIRHDLHESLKLPPTQPLPFNRFLVGTIALFIIATIFALFTLAVSQRYRFLWSQYKQFRGVPPLAPRNRWARYLAISCYYVFPAMDILIRVYVTDIIR